ncbi:hypothetical protein BOX15_Mlig030900g1 [Macrostomum lignano]|uniref:Carbonic anhydrase n=2 Tax=Macrostomum lignano TaxID=282301 RepID=A0A1I8HLA8_9PLAT|nr:hypothetical protein BOX15_Mlig030900g1 [Macrostomum lignano]
MQRGKKQPSWGYDNENGPHTWSRFFPKAAGAFQSPVNLDFGQAVFSAKLNNPPLRCAYQDLPDCQLSNTGHSFQVASGSGDLATVEGGPLLCRYQFAQFHMHWGSGDSWGSEHALNGRLFPAELHLVHWNAGKFSSFQEAAAIKDGLAVLGVFVDIGAEHPAMARVLQHFDKIRAPGSKVPLAEPINLANFLPANLTEIFSYEGSLTTPPCFESVQWTVFREPISMSAEQFAQLRSLSCGHASPTGDREQQMVDNYRHLIPLGKRRLVTSCSPEVLRDGK